MGLLNFIARISLNSSAFEQGMKGVKNSVKTAAGEMSASLKNELGNVLGAGAIAAAFRDLVKYASAINDASEALGIGTDALQAYEYAAKQTGASLQDLEGAFRHLSKSKLAAVQNPLGEEAQVFNALKVSPAGSQQQTFEGIAAAIKNTDFGPAAEAMVEKLLGRGATTLMPMFVEGLDEATQAFQELNIALSPETIHQLDEFGDSLERLHAMTRGPLAQAFTYLVDVVNAAVRGLKILVGGIGGGLGRSSEAAGGGKLGMFETINALLNPLTFGKRAKDLRTQFAAGFMDNLDDVLKNEQDAKDAQANAKVKRELNPRIKRDFQFTPTKQFDYGAFKQQSDSLTSIGNFLGVDPNSKTLNELGVIEKVLRSIDSKLDKNGPGGNPFPQ